jgi:hypothetical protein
VIRVRARTKLPQFLHKNNSFSYSNPMVMGITCCVLWPAKKGLFIEPHSSHGNKALQWEDVEEVCQSVSSEAKINITTQMHGRQ